MSKSQFALRSTSNIDFPLPFTANSPFRSCDFQDFLSCGNKISSGDKHTLHLPLFSPLQGLYCFILFLVLSVASVSKRWSLPWPDDFVNVVPSVFVGVLIVNVDMVDCFLSIVLIVSLIETFYLMIPFPFLQPLL